MQPSRGGPRRIDVHERRPRSTPPRPSHPIPRRVRPELQAPPQYRPQPRPPNRPRASCGSSRIHALDAAAQARLPHRLFRCPESSWCGLLDGSIRLEPSQRRWHGHELGHGIGRDSHRTSLPKPACPAGITHRFRVTCHVNHPVELIELEWSNRRMTSTITVWTLTRNGSARRRFECSDR